MATQFITNDRGEKTAVIIPIADYEDLLHHHHLKLDVTDEYKTIMDKLLDQEENETAQYISFQSLKNRFLNK